MGSNSIEYEAIWRVMDLLCVETKYNDISPDKSTKSSRKLSMKETGTANHKYKDTFNTLDDITPEGDKENKNALNIQPQDLVIVDTTVSKSKKKVGRKPKNRLKKDIPKPVVKKEVIQRKHRAETTYRLRKNIKKVKFMDEVSEPSDLDDEDDKEHFDDLTSMSESDEYKPDAELVEGDQNLNESEGHLVSKLTEIQKNEQKQI